jgi:hypothetical protein
MSASLYELIGRTIDPQWAPRQPTARSSPLQGGESLSELIGRTIGAPGAWRTQPAVVSAPAGQRAAA